MRGTYTIIIHCATEGRCRFGELGSVRLRKGHYVYTGSALGDGAVSLEGRLARHARRVKKRRWHIDYLTSLPQCRVGDAVYLISTKCLECKINQAIGTELSLSPALHGIGASDCNCPGHLLGPEVRLSKKALTRRILKAYHRFGFQVYSVTIQGQIG